jgi:hypothetical protein
MRIIGQLAQIIIALGICNVWILRSNRATGYRGGSARNMKEEFAAYGLPPWSVGVVGTLKIALAAALIVGLWIPYLVLPAASGMAVLMIGAVAMHSKVADPTKKAVPAMCMLVLSVIAALA